MMNTRHAFIAAAAVLGLAAGPALRASPLAGLDWGWSSGVFAFMGGAFGPLVLLTWMAANGQYRAMVRAWSLIGLLALALAAAGSSAMSLALAASAGIEKPSLAVLLLGIGLIAGLGLVKLALHRARVRQGV